MKATERKAWSCANCAKVHLFESEAEMCCREREYTCKACGKLDANPPWTAPAVREGLCSMCYFTKEKIEKWQALEKMRPEDWKGPVYLENTDRYYEDMDILLDDIADGDCEGQLPRVYGCDVESPDFDLHTEMAERIDDNGGEGLSDQLDDEKLMGLQHQIDQMLKGMFYWEPNFKKPIDVTGALAGK